MEKAFAYICAAQDAAPRLLRRYCHKVYELGYVPICPKLSLPQYLSAGRARRTAGHEPDQPAAFASVPDAGGVRKRNHHSHGGEIGTAEKLKLICTTLDGLAKIRENENRYVN